MDQAISILGGQALKRAQGVGTKERARLDKAPSTTLCVDFLEALSFKPLLEIKRNIKPQQ